MLATAASAGNLVPGNEDGSPSLPTMFHIRLLVLLRLPLVAASGCTSRHRWALIAPKWLGFKVHLSDARQQWVICQKPGDLLQLCSFSQENAGLGPARSSYRSRNTSVSDCFDPHHCYGLTPG